MNEKLAENSVVVTGAAGTLHHAVLRPPPEGAAVVEAERDLTNDQRRHPRHKITVPEAVDVSNAADLLRTLFQAIDQAPDGIEVEMSTAGFVGVAGWRVLLRSARYAADRAPFTLSGLSARHRRTAELIGLSAALRGLEPCDEPGLLERPDELAPAE
ncbi:MAG: STAS domain-containing protein [Acidobacteriota bacterium]|nr:STAS domain-containing protein [Acidobacteriota bacterium]